MYSPLQLPSLPFQSKFKPFDLINVKPLLVPLTQSHHWSEIQAVQACRRYLNFLYLMWLYPDRLLVPTQEIDLVWHCHILNTRQYRQDCQNLFGHYLDHDPCESPDQATDPSLLAAFGQTKLLFERHFGAGSFENCVKDGAAACGRPGL